MAIAAFVDMADAPPELEGARFLRTRPRRPDDLLIVGVEGAQPSRGEALLFGLAGVIAPLRARPGPFPAIDRAPYELRHAFDQGPEAQLALLERLERDALIVDVGARREPMDDVAAIVEKR